MKKLFVTAFLSCTPIFSGCSTVHEMHEAVKGEQGEQGDRGPQGPRGAQGARGGVGALVIREVSDGGGQPGDLVTVQAFCADDERAIAGGCQYGKYPGNVLPTASMPIGVYDEGEELPSIDGWQCVGLVAPEVEHVESITTFIICEEND